MNILIVLAHHEARSFNGILKDKAVEVLTREKHQVQVSDLYAMQFKAEADRADFKEAYNPEYFRYYREQLNAHQKQLFMEDIVKEQEKLLWTDVLILQFPVWWYSVPAILKGWIDRVFAYGFCYGDGKSSFETGFFRGKKAFLSITKGGPLKPDLSTEADEETLKEMYHIHEGLLAFMGYEVLPAFVAYGIPRSKAEEKAEYLKQFEEKLLGIG